MPDLNRHSRNLPLSLPRPLVSITDAADALLTHWGISADTIVELGSQQDRNFRVDWQGTSAVLKFGNPATARSQISNQHRALAGLAEAVPALRFPAPIPARGGSEIVKVNIQGVGLPVRLVTWVAGENLTDRPIGATTAASLGEAAGLVAAALAGLELPFERPVTPWDLRLAEHLVQELSASIADDAIREAVLVAATEAAERIRAVSAVEPLPVQLIHGDITDDNVVTGASGEQVTGLIDFGDLGPGWRVAELAVGVAATLHHNENDPFVVLEQIRAFDAVVALRESEIRAIWPLVVLRGAALVAAGRHQVKVDGDNAYAEQALDRELAAFRVATEIGFDEAEFAIRAAIRPTIPAAIPTPIRTEQIGSLLRVPGGIRFLDLGVRSEHLDRGLWLDHQIEHRLAAAAFTPGCAVATRYGQARLTRTAPPAPIAPKTVSLAIDVWAGLGEEVFAPFAGTVHWQGDVLMLTAPELELRITGAAKLAGAEATETAPASTTAAASAPPPAMATATEPAGSTAPQHGGSVESGEPIAQIARGVEVAPNVGHLVITASRIPGLAPPHFVRAADAAFFTDSCPDPTLWIGGPTAPGTLGAQPSNAAELLQRRDAVFATVHERYFDRPPRIERGWRHWLIDEDARCYLDMLNNVSVVGHGHPRIADAAARQWLRLNTNSRFLYEELVTYSERLAALAPEGLDSVFLVNSGSEAVDLALRLVQAATERKTIVALREAYHGWTMASDAVSSSLNDNPAAIGTRPEWVHLADAPNPIRGTHRGDATAGAYLTDFRELLANLDRAGTPPAGFIAEAIFGNGGGVLLPDGYLAGAFEAVRALGGLCIADEVQVGFGRLGEHFWAFEQQGAVPDVITVAKSIGNGQPLGAVIVRRWIAEAFASEGSFFSSAGGSPVSCAVGNAVLDVLEDEALIENARITGGRLKCALETLASKHPAIGAVHGMGFYLGVELVSDRTAMTPDGELAHAICERLLDAGIIVLPTGDGRNVLKIKPPMTLDAAGVDYFVARLDAALRHLDKSPTATS